MIYLLHFERPYFHARHYIGFAEHDVEQRIETHRRGNGARLLRAVASARIKFSIVRTWEGDRHFERRLKRRKKSWRLCPVCKKERKG